MIHGFRAGAGMTVAGLLLGACASAPSPYARAADPSESAASSAALDSARRVADWQLGHLDDLSYLRTFQRQSADPTGWIQATFYIGLTALADATGDARYAEAVLRHGRELDWRLGARPRHADDEAIGQAWVWAAAHSQPAMREAQLAPLRARFDAVLTAPSSTSLTFDEAPGDRACQARWCWSDALFMAPPVWFELTRLTGDPRYAAHADREYQAAVDRLFDREAGLFYRDSRFIGQRSAAGHKVFWSRGNGWTYSGLAAIIDSLAPNDPRRARYVDLFRDMSVSLVALQGAEGYWPVSLLDPGGPPETSGSGFIVHGLAWGVNAGLLDGPQYKEAVRRGWAALHRAVDDDGRLGWVQQVGYAPDEVLASDTQLYGSGAYLLAAAEVAKRPYW